MPIVPKRFRGEIILKPNSYYKISDDFKNTVLSCGLDFIPFALAKYPDFKSNVTVGSLFVFDQSSLLYRIRYDGWELWRLLDKDKFRFVKGWLYRPLKNEEKTTNPIWLLNICIDFVE